MARRSGFGQLATSMVRIAAQQAAAQARQAERQQRAAVYQSEKNLRLWAKQEAQQRLLTDMEEASTLNEGLAASVAYLESILSFAIAHPIPFSFAALRSVATYPTFDAGGLDRGADRPVLAHYLPPPLSKIGALVPGAKTRFDRDIAAAHEAYDEDLEAYKAAEQDRFARLNDRRLAHDATVRDIDERVATDNAFIDRMQSSVDAGDPAAIVTCCALCFGLRDAPDGWPRAPSERAIAYVPPSRQLVVEYDLPSADVVPAVSAYRYIKSTNQIVSTARPAAQRKALYTGLVAQMALRTLHDLFASEATTSVDTIVFNGYVDSVDPGTGQTIRPCLVTVRVTRDLWNQFDLARVDPVACLKALNAAVSKNPSELAPVRPVMELSMVDPRFIAQDDVLAGLDERPNLMDLTPNEFEALIANLFGKMGLETRLTQASRDGGVDCVAYDLDPVLGGKVVIQAKRYKHTVGVSAVRDLYGTVQNEGASKGVLVTTSGYGKAAFDFAQNKPLTLLDGTNLLYLLATHAGIEARILAPDDWHDPLPDNQAADA